MSVNFNDIIAVRVSKIQQVLYKKAEEYATTGDRFHNFRVAARINNETPERALLGMWIKHFISVLDMIDWIDQCPKKITLELIDEKIGDNINYLILLEGLLLERLSQ